MKSRWITGGEFTRFGGYHALEPEKRRDGSVDLFISLALFLDCTCDLMFLRRSALLAARLD